MGNFILFLGRFLAFHFLFSSVHKSAAFHISKPKESSNHFHIVEVSSLATASTCSPSSRVSNEEGSLKLVHNQGPCSAKRNVKANAPSAGEILEGDQKRVSFKAWMQNHGEKGIHVKWDSYNTDEYVVNVGIGTPKRELTFVMDTGSDLLWTQCQPCKVGSLKGCYKQRRPIFNPSKSSTYTNVTCPSCTCSRANTTLGLTTCISTRCVYETAYLDGTEDAGFLAKESVRVGSNIFNDIIFGCNEVNVNSNIEPIDGIIGLGQGFLSFVEQTAKTYQKVFSYCLPSKPSEVGFLKFGRNAEQVSRPLNFTRLGEGYAIELVGIKLGNTTIPISVKKGFATIDSGTVISRLPPKDYAKLREAYRQAMTHYRLLESQDGDVLDTCYHIGGREKLKLPKMSFLFGDGLVLDIPPNGVAFPMNSDVVCLPFAAPPGGEEDIVLFGNTQQKTLEIVYDLVGGKLGFGYDGCN